MGSAYTLEAIMNRVLPHCLESLTCINFFQLFIFIYLYFHLRTLSDGSVIFPGVSALMSVGMYNYSFLCHPKGAGYLYQSVIESGLNELYILEDIVTATGTETPVCYSGGLIPVCPRKSRTWGHRSQLTLWYGGLL